MIICDYCENYATNGYCNKCPYGSLLEADIYGEVGYYGEQAHWTEERAEKELDRLKKELKWEDK